MKEKKLLALLLVAAMALTLFAACQGKEAPVPSQTVSVTTAPDTTSNPATEQPAEEQKEPVRILSEITGGRDPEEHELWVKEFSEKSGVKTEMDIVSGSTEYQNKLAAVLASGGADYDCVYMTANTYAKLAANDLFMPLTDLIKASPVLGNLEAFPEKEWNKLRQPDGQIYTIFNNGEMGRLPIIRADWIEKLGLNPNPKSLDDYYTIFKAFTDQDPDGNGENDTYGLTICGTYDMQPFMSEYGLDDKFKQDENGKWYAPWATDEAIPVYEWFAKLYDEGILDKNFATNSSSASRELIMTDKAGCFVYWQNWIGFFTEKVKAESPDSPFKLLGGMPCLDADGNGYLTTGASSLWAVLNTSKNKDYAFKALEFMQTDAGIRLSSIGVEGWDYTLDANGKPVYTDVGKEHAGDHGANIPKSMLYVSPFDKLPEELAAVKVVYEYGRPVNSREYGDDFEEMSSKYMAYIIFGEKTAAEAMEEFRAELKTKGMID